MFLIMETYLKNTVRDRFFAPAEDALNQSRHTRSCPAFTDIEHLHAGVGRVLEQVASGRDWVQRLAHFLGRIISVGCFFQSLRSRRRLDLLNGINDTLASRCRALGGDPFAGHEELDRFAIYAGDGHYHQCSVHEDETGGKRRPVGHVYVTNLRTQALSHLDIARPDTARGKKREHEITTLKRLPPKELRMGEPAGTKVMLVYDMAVLDLNQWYKWKQGSGIYIVTRERGNMKPQILGTPEFDRDDPRNAGVIADQFVGTSQNLMVRRIVYVDPVTNEEYRFLTNEPNIPPGLIAFIYKKRWDIEKVFDQHKNKFDEKKAWAKGPVAKCQQALFQCIAHNLMLLFEHQLRDEGVTDKIADGRRRERARRAAEKAKKNGKDINPMVIAVGKRVQRSLQFIRWLRLHIAHGTPWTPAIRALRPLMQAYLI